jgi:hypothetical protein
MCPLLVCMVGYEGVQEFYHQCFCQCVVNFTYWLRSGLFRRSWKSLKDYDFSDWLLILS